MYHVLASVTLDCVDSPDGLCMVAGRRIRHAGGGMAPFLSGSVLRIHAITRNEFVYKLSHRMRVLNVLAAANRRDHDIKLA